VSRRSRQPRDPLEHLLVAIWEDVLHVAPVGIDEPFGAHGGDPAQAAVTRARIAAACDVTLPADALGPATTVARLGRRVKDEGRDVLSRRARVLVDGRLADTAPRPLFFVHGDPNGAGVYCVALSRALGPDVPLCALTPPGPYGPEPYAGRYPSVPDMADFHIASLRAVQPRGPYRVGGFCLGGTVAYEMARRLRAQGEEVRPLVMVAAVHWSRFWRLRRASRWVGRRLGVPHETELSWFLRTRDALQPWFGRYDRHVRLRHEPPRRFYPSVPLRRSVTGALGRLVGRGRARDDEADAPTPEAEETRDRWRLWFQLERVNRDYVPGPYDGPTTVLWAEREPIRQPGEPWTIWGRVARHLTVHVIPGGHNDALVRHAAVAAARIREAL